jgi:hypothetical protein
VKTNRQKNHWIVDAVLFTAFLLCFWMDLSGLALHQWLGIAAGVLAGYHLIAHWSWVTSITGRLKRTPGRTRTYYLLDIGLAAGFAVILISGLGMSTWLALPLPNYLAWKNWHVISSVATLALAALKIALHWRWVVTVAKRHILAPRPMTRPQLAQSTTASQPTRREFLKLMGVVGAAAALGIASGLQALGQSFAQVSAAPLDETAAPPDAPLATPQPDDVSVNVSSASPSPTPLAVPQAAPTGIPQVIPTAQPTPIPTAAQSCVARCPNRCSYPGRCRRYVDTNRNKLCDLGECM